MSNREKKHNNQFKENENAGEQRNGRKSPYKNFNPDAGDSPNQYLDNKK
ncbi:hypothetical protein [Oceanobacillus massiliensis]|nr:hypothetical protein [Oceanobacillus massiliensis]